MSRSYPPPTTTGKIPFAPLGINTLCETSYSLWGSLTSSAAAALICLHGGPGTPSQYLLPLCLLHKETGIPVLLYDQIGCGDSTHLQHKKGDAEFWIFDLFIAELHNLIAHLGIETYDLFGHSWGGMLAARYALTQPRGLRKLLLASTSASTKLRLQANAQQKSDLPVEIRETLARCEEQGTTDTPEYRNAMAEFYRRHLCRIDPPPKEFLDSMASMQQDDTVYSTLMGPSPLSPTGLLKDFNISGELSQITEKTIPGGMLILNGKFDTTQDEVTVPFFTQPRARVKWVRFAESSHMAMLEETKSFLAAVRGFLEMP